jgi:hypothetical protein
MRSTDIDTMFPRAEWDLLVSLPGQVVVAATSADADGSRRSVAEALGGLDAIAAGRDSPNALVRGVVGAIYSERGVDPTVFGATDRATGLAQVVVACRQAAAALAEHGTADDRAAYEQWLESIAFRVCDVTDPADASSPDGPDATERRFLSDLADAFR